MRHSYIDQHSGLNSIIHHMDPAVKAVCSALFILLVNIARQDSFVFFGVCGAFILTLILLSKLPPAFVLKRSLAVMPFVVFIAAFLPFMRDDGLAIFRNVIIKAYLSILCMILLIGTTEFSRLLKALERLKTPRLFIMIISFMYRYIFVIMDELMKTNQAKQARSIGATRWLHTKVLANMLGVLFVKSYERAENIYLAMCSRGFDGSIRTYDDAEKQNNRD